uniref:Uncharacterized protein n=1 Tax=Anguilla anguilla TaxID=7936 RepID=A0A0E9QKI9_ANGAN
MWIANERSRLWKLCSYWTVVTARSDYRL